jgi:AraC-like DNA-binding protein
MGDARTDILDGRHSCFTFAAPVFADEPMRRLFDTAFSHSAAAARRGNAMVCETAILNLIAGLNSHASARPEIDRGPTACIRRVRNRIDADPAARLTLVELANEIGLSRYQLLRAFARDLGLTPHAYIIQRRIELARRLIRSGRELAEVAVAAGFCDQSHLTRCFARRFGVTPRRYASSTA